MLLWTSGAIWRLWLSALVPVSSRAQYLNLADGYELVVITSQGWCEWESARGRACAAWDNYGLPGKGRIWENSCGSAQTQPNVFLEWDWSFTSNKVFLDTFLSGVFHAIISFHQNSIQRGLGLPPDMMFWNCFLKFLIHLCFSVADFWYFVGWSNKQPALAGLYELCWRLWALQVRSSTFAHLNPGKRKLFEGLFSPQIMSDTIMPVVLEYISSLSVILYKFGQLYAFG